MSTNKVEIEINPNYYCPITKQIMIDPVLAADGYVYEREAIIGWLKDHDTSPKTHAILETKMVFPNLNLQREITQFLSQNPVLYSQDVVYLPQTSVDGLIKVITMDVKISALKAYLQKDPRLLLIPLQEEQTLFHLICVQGSLELFADFLKYAKEINQLEFILKLKRPENWIPKQLNQLFVRELFENKIDDLDLYLQLGADIEQPDLENNETLLHKASVQNKIDTALVLITKDAKLEAKTKDGDTPFLLAVKKGLHELVKALLAKNADIHVLDRDNKNALWIAIDNDDLEMFRILLANEANLRQVPLLHHAIRKNKIEVITLLIEVIAFLIDENIPYIPFKELDEEKETVLHSAMLREQYDIVRLLISKNVEITTKSQNIKHLGFTILHLCIQMRAYSMIGFLITTAKEAKINLLDIQDDKGDTALHLAARLSDQKIITQLLEAGASTNIENKSEKTFIQVAQEAEKLECVSFIQEKLKSVERAKKNEKFDQLMNLVLQLKQENDFLKEEIQFLKKNQNNSNEKKLIIPTFSSSSFLTLFEEQNRKLSLISKDYGSGVFSKPQKLKSYSQKIIGMLSTSQGLLWIVLADKSLSLFDTVSNQFCKVPKVEEAFINAIVEDNFVMLADGTVATPEGKVVRIWNADTAECLNTIELGKHEVNQAAKFAALQNGKFMTLADTGILYYWELEEEKYKEIKQFDLFESCVVPVAQNMFLSYLKNDYDIRPHQLNFCAVMMLSNGYVGVLTIRPSCEYQNTVEVRALSCYFIFFDPDNIEQTSEIFDSSLSGVRSKFNNGDMKARKEYSKVLSNALSERYKKPLDKILYASPLDLAGKIISVTSTYPDLQKQHYQNMIYRTACHPRIVQRVYSSRKDKIFVQYNIPVEGVSDCRVKNVSENQYTKGLGSSIKTLSEKLNKLSSGKKQKSIIECLDLSELSPIEVSDTNNKNNKYKVGSQCKSTQLSLEIFAQSPDQKFYAYSDGAQIFFHDASSDKLLHTLDVKATYLTWLPDGRVVSAYEHKISIWDFPKLELKEVEENVNEEKIEFKN